MSNATNELLHALHKCVILDFRFGSFGYFKTQKFHLTKGRFLIFLSYERSGHGEISHKVFFPNIQFRVGIFPLLFDKLSVFSNSMNLLEEWSYIFI